MLGCVAIQVQCHLPYLNTHTDLGNVNTAQYYMRKLLTNPKVRAARCSGSTRISISQVCELPVQKLNSLFGLSKTGEPGLSPRGEWHPVGRQQRGTATLGTGKGFRGGPHCSGLSSCRTACSG